MSMQVYTACLPPAYLSTYLPPTAYQPAHTHVPTSSGCADISPRTRRSAPHPYSPTTTYQLPPHDPTLTGEQLMLEVVQHLLERGVRVLGEVGVGKQGLSTSSSDRHSQHLHWVALTRSESRFWVALR